MSTFSLYDFRLSFRHVVSFVTGLDWTRISRMVRMVARRPRPLPRVGSFRFPHFVIILASCQDLGSKSAGRCLTRLDGKALAVHRPSRPAPVRSSIGTSVANWWSAKGMALPPWIHGCVACTLFSRSRRSFSSWRIRSRRTSSRRTRKLSRSSYLVANDRSCSEGL